MTRHFWLLAACQVLLAANAHLGLAQQVEPAGDRVGVDPGGAPVYQLPVNGVRIGYKLVGAGKPLVLIPGLANTMDVWPKELVALLSGKFQLILPDNRGMGQSTANDAAFTYRLFADDVIGLLDALGVKKAHVLGFSMGSVITQELLLEYPQRFDKAVVYATSTDGSKVAAALAAALAEDPAMLQKIPPTVVRQLEATTRWKTPLNRVPMIANQVMFVVGTADTVVGTESSKTLSGAVPGAWLAQFRQGSHVVMREAPAEFARIVFDFFDMNETVGVK